MRLLGTTKVIKYRESYTKVKRDVAGFIGRCAEMEGKRGEVVADKAKKWVHLQGALVETCAYLGEFADIRYLESFSKTRSATRTTLAYLAPALGAVWNGGKTRSNPPLADCSKASRACSAAFIL